MKTSTTQRLGQILLQPDRLEREPDKNSLIDFLIEQQLGPCLLQNKNLILSSAVQIRLQSQMMINEIFFQQLATVESALKKEKILFSRVKGSALYFEKPRRIMKDIDLFVPDDRDFGTAEIILSELGFKKKAQLRWEGADNRFDYFLKLAPYDLEFHIDLHRDLYWKSSLSGAWNIVQENDIPVLAPEDLFFHLVTNWLYQDGGVDFYKIFDLFTLLNSKNNFSWERLRYLARKEKLEHIVALAISVVDRTFNSNWSLHWSVPKKIAGFSAKLVATDFFLNPKKQWFQYLFLKHWVRATWAQALYYDFLWVKAYWKPWFRIFSSRVSAWWRRDRSMSTADGLH